MVEVRGSETCCQACFPDQIPNLDPQPIKSQEFSTAGTFIIYWEFEKQQGVSIQTNQGINLPEPRARRWVFRFPGILEGWGGEKCGVVEHNHLQNGAKEATLGAQSQQVLFSISAKEEFQWDSDRLAGGRGRKRAGN